MEATFTAITLMGYLGAAILSVAQLYDVKQAKWAGLLGWTGFLAQTGQLTLSARAAHTFPVVTLHDWVAFFVWLAVGLYLLFGRRMGLTPVSAFLLPTAFVIWLGGQAVSGRVLVAPSHTAYGPWLVMHLVLTAFGDASFLLAAVFGIMYIEKERELKKKRIRLFYYQLPALEDMDSWTGRFILVGWLVYTMALIFGAVATHAVGKPFWTGQELGALGIWALYGALASARRVLHWNGHRIATLSMIAFMAVVVNVFGIGLILSGPYHTAI